ncbi:MAG TPA: dockerin type I domain-containing protein, partial [Chthoniobacterales bacterium]
PLTVGGSLEIDPGVVVKVTPYSYVNDVSFGDGMRAFGTKQNPITFERADPSLAWHGLHADRSEGGRLRHVIIDGSSDGVNGGEWRVENAIFRNNGIGTNGGARVSGSQYLANATGHWTAGNLNSATNPNSFEGNQYGVRYSDDARNSWWGSPSGPTTPKNPGGTGDRIASELTQFKPFLTSRPNYNDAPPEVRMLRPHFQQDPGSKTTLRWESTDDGSIVSHKVLFSAVGNYVGSFQTVATLPGNQRSYEFTVPAIGFQVAGANSFIKVVAVDNTGKESFDEWEVVVPTNTIQGGVTFGITPGAVFEPGQELGDPADRSAVDPNMSRVESYIEVIGVPNRKMFTNGGFSMPFLSSDTVRFVESYGDTSNRRKYWYSPIFSVRPKASLGDAPPAIALVSPGAGASFGPGTIIPISWTASDDEGLRGFDIVASFDNARTWQPVVANLPGNARSYDWQMAPGSGFANVRVMVIAKDWRFQTSSAGRDRVFSTNSNNPSPTVANLIVNPTQIATGQSATGTVTLSQAAPAGGTLVTVSHDGQMFLTTPANITVPAGSSTGTFPVDTTNIAIAHTFQITATAGGVTRNAPLTVTLALTALDLPESAPSNSSVSGTVTLSGPAPAGGAVVNLSSTDPDVAGVPASVTIAEGAQSANFTTTTSSVTSQKSITISGEHAGTVKQTTISVAPAPVPVQFTAVSRKTHSGVGEIDLNLPLTGTPAIESRSGGTAGDHQIVITFSQPVSLTNANVTSGTGSVSGWSSDGAQVIVNLTGVANAQRIGVTLGGGSTAEYYVPMSVLAADTNGDGNVNSGDASQTRSRSGQAASSTNFRSDVNLDGNINSGDAI